MHQHFVFSNLVDLGEGRRYHFDGDDFSAFEVFGEFDLPIRTKSDGDMVVFVAFKHLEPVLDEHYNLLCTHTDTHPFPPTTLTIPIHYYN